MPAVDDEVDEHQQVKIQWNFAEISQAIQQEQQLMEDIINQDDNEDGNPLGLIAPNEENHKGKKQVNKDYIKFLIKLEYDKLWSSWIFDDRRCGLVHNWPETFIELGGTQSLEIQSQWFQR